MFLNNKAKWGQINTGLQQVIKDVEQGWSVKKHREEWEETFEDKCDPEKKRAMYSYVKRNQKSDEEGPKEWKWNYDNIN